MKIFNKGFNFNQDGPGNRLVYHLSGCNMRCWWCANPEGFECNSGTHISVDEIVNECLNCLPMFFSQGGVTFTGGECTVQFDELFSVLQKLKEYGINTAVETNGTCSRLPELLPFIDYLIMDFKHFDDDELIKFTGQNTAIIKRNYEWNCANKIKQHIRIPLINGVNTDNPFGFVDYFKMFDNSNTVFEFIKYHEFGKKKWQTEYKITNGFVSDEKVQEFVCLFEKNNLKVVRT